MNTLFYSFTIGMLLAIIIIFLVYFLKKVSRTQLQQIFSVNMILLITTCVFIFLQMQLSEALNIEPIYFAYFYYIGIVFFPVSLYFAVKIFTKTKIKFKTWNFALFIIPLICLLGLWTNNRTNLFFINYDINIDNCKFGPLFVLNEIYSYVLYLACLFDLFKYFRNNSNLYSKQLSLFLIGILFPFIMNLLGALKIIETTIYIAPISSAISIICFTLALLKYQTFNTLPIALSKIIDRISDGYIVLNEKNIITNFNETFLKIFDIEEKTIEGMHLFELIDSPNFKGITEKTMISALKSIKDSNETLIFEKEFPNINKFITFEMNNIKSEDVYIGSLILVKNMTEHHKDLEIIKTNQHVLMEKERLASLGEMISGVAHNLKTPIFSIAGASEGLLDLVNEYSSSIDDETVTIEDHKAIAKDMETWIYKIKDYTTYMSDIITAIRGQAASFTENPFESFTIEEVLKRVNILMKHELQQALCTLNITYNLDEEITLHGNINSLVQIINNVIANAIQSYEGKTNESINLTVEKSGKKKLKVIVEDHGVGIPEEIKDKLFKEIITTKGYEGTGLGLFISSSNLKTQFNGDMKFKSVENQGTTFEITIPIQ